MSKTVTSDELSQAYRLFREATERDTAILAPVLGVSRPTLDNYMSERTQPQIDCDQASTMALDITDRIIKLAKALEVFRSITLSPPTTRNE
jgi:hypothetical protein